MKVTADNGLNLRSGPGTTYDAVTTLATGALLTITSIESNGWLGVKTQGGVTGYVHPDYVVVYDGGNEDPGVASGAKLSSSSLSLAQYQSVRLDGSVSENISAMKWQSSDPSVAYVAYTIPYGSTTQMAMIYGCLLYTSGRIWDGNRVQENVYNSQAQGCSQCVQKEVPQARAPAGEPS